MHILVVDDEQLVRSGIARMLEDCPGVCEVRTACDGFEALRELRESQVDLAICDIRMPEMSGLELIACAREQQLCKRFLILSSYADFSYAKQAIDLGVSGYLLKPVEQKELFERVQEAASSIKAQRMPVEGPRETAVPLPCLRVHMAEKALSPDEVDALLGQVLALPRQTLPQSLRVLLLLELALCRPALKGRIAGALAGGAFVELTDAAALALLEVLKRLIECDTAERTVREVLGYLIKNAFSPTLCLTTAARALYLNANYLSGLISRSLGISFIRMVSLLRVTRAQELLKREAVPSIQSIAQQCGFENTNHFFRVFKATTQMTPKCYRMGGN